MTTAPVVTKDEWVHALRSGNFPKGKGYLKTSMGNFCCLGVLCVLKGVNLNDLNAIQLQIEDISELAPFHSGKDPLMRWLHSTSDDNDRSPGCHLAGINDAYGPNGDSFDTVIDYIEANYEEPK